MRFRTPGALGEQNPVCPFIPTYKLHYTTLLRFCNKKIEIIFTPRKLLITRNLSPTGRDEVSSCCQDEVCWCTCSAFRYSGRLSCCCPLPGQDRSFLPISHASFSHEDGLSHTLSGPSRLVSHGAFRLPPCSHHRIQVNQRRFRQRHQGQRCNLPLCYTRFRRWTGKFYPPIWRAGSDTDPCSGADWIKSFFACYCPLPGQGKSFLFASACRHAERTIPSSLSGAAPLVSTPSLAGLARY
jgi:hypothetical protein